MILRKKMKILAFGEIIWDTYPNMSFIGGAPLNFCAHCVRCGAKGFILSAVGIDSLRDVTYAELSRLGVNAEFVQENEQPTGQCLVTLDSRSIPSYRLFENAAYDYIKGGNELITKIKREKFDAFCFGTLAQRNAASRSTLLEILKGCRFSEVYCDINLRNGCYDTQSLVNCLSYATILKLSEEEEPWLRGYDFWPAGEHMTDKAVALFGDHPELSRIIFTRGDKGAEIFTREHGSFMVSAYGDKVVSTVGAGDSYGAVWLSMYLANYSDREAAEIASRVSGYVVSVPEAVPDYDIGTFTGKKVFNKEAT